jgi:magnesium chelatase family protein
VAAMNPCPCGRAGQEGQTCRCPDAVAARYTDRVSGPLRDRIDLWVSMTRVAPAAVVAIETPESSGAVADRVAAARRCQLARSGTLNATLAGRALRASCRLDRPAAARAVELAELEGLSARGTERLLRVARTVADLVGSAVVGCEALEEAARYRSPSRVLDRRMAV